MGATILPGLTKSPFRAAVLLYHATVQHHTPLTIAALTPAGDLHSDMPHEIPDCKRAILSATPTGPLLDLPKGSAGRSSDTTAETGAFQLLSEKMIRPKHLPKKRGTPPADSIPSEESPATALVQQPAPADPIGSFDHMHVKADKIPMGFEFLLFQVHTAGNEKLIFRESSILFHFST